VAVLALSGVAWAATALAVTKTVPSSGATGVTRTANIKAYFNHDMRASTVTSSTFKIRKQGTTTWIGATRSVNNTISPTPTKGGSQSVATLNPNSDLALNTTYQVVIVGGSSGVKDVNGNTLSANKSWTFTTVAPPNTTIDSGPSGTVASDSATFTFSSSKPNSAFKCSLDDSANSAFSGCISLESYSGLSQGPHTFWVKAIDASGITDPTPASRSWTVDTIAPTVNNVSPADAATGVALDTNVTATFSEAMDATTSDGDPSTIDGSTFTLTKPDGPDADTNPDAVTAGVSYDSANKKATLDPSSDLASGTTYTATLSTGVKDLVGNASAQEETWSFTTEVLTGVTITPNPLDLDTNDPLFCTAPPENLTVTNNGPGDVTFAAVSITGLDATYFSDGASSYIANNGPFTVLAGNHFFDQVTFRPGSTPTDKNRDDEATLTHKDSTGATIGDSGRLTATASCLVF
jgi:hypothetical protein